jgi:hypothetical protein
MFICELLETVTIGEFAPFAPTWGSSRRTCASKFTDFLKDTYTTAAKGGTDYNFKVIEIARTNINAAFDYAYKLRG